MNKKFLRVMGIILSVVMLFSFAVVANAATGKVTVRVEGIEGYINSASKYITSARTLKDILKEIDVDVVFADNSDEIISVEGEAATDNSKWHVLVNSAFVTSDFSSYIIDGETVIVLCNAAEDVVCPQIEDGELASSGILTFNGIDKNGDVAPLAGLKVIWDNATSFTTDKDGKIYIPIEYLEKGDHEIAISKVNADKVPTVVRLAKGETVNVGEIDLEEKEEESSFQGIYDFFYSIFKGIVEVWAFYLSAIAGLLGISF